MIPVETSEAKTNGHLPSGSDQAAKEKKIQPKKQAQRREKPKQDTFTNDLLVTNLKGEGGEGGR